MVRAVASGSVAGPSSVVGTPKPPMKPMAQRNVARNRAYNSRQSPPRR